MRYEAPFVNICNSDMSEGNYIYMCIYMCIYMYIYIYITRPLMYPYPISVTRVTPCRLATHVGKLIHVISIFAAPDLFLFPVLLSISAAAGVVAIRYHQDDVNLCNLSAQHYTKWYFICDTTSVARCITQLKQQTAMSIWRPGIYRLIFNRCHVKHYVKYNI